MSADQVPSRAEVMGWSPQQLASYLKKMNLSGCDKAVMKNSISGSRFVNLSDTDLQKFPKLHAPLISKISTEISKKEERRGLFGLRMTKYQEPVNPCPLPSAEVMDDGWGEEEFESEDDYESPYSGDEEGSGGDYESPNEDQDGANDYEPPPTEPPEDLPHTRCTNLPTGDYIDQRASLPPAISPRPPVPSLPAPSRKPGEPPRRDPSPHCGGRPSGSLPPEPPKIYRGNKPGKDPGSTPTRGPHRNTLATPGAQSWRPQQETPDPPSWSKPPVLPPTSSIGRSNSSARVPSARFERTEGRRETNDDAPKHNTFPLQHKNMPPRSGLPGPPSRHGDSLPPNVPKVHPGMGDLRVSSLGSDRQSFRPPLPSSSRSQEMDPRWYVGKVTRGQAEGCLKRVNKDGAYLVRDSTRQLENQPFTLMVFYQDKVFNIQIRQQNQQFLLGTGLKVQECFPTVSDIINHYSQSPLLLIDAKNRRSSQQNQCLLSDPAGFCMTGQNWS